MCIVSKQLKGGCKMSDNKPVKKRTRKDLSWDGNEKLLPGDGGRYLESSSW